MQAIINATVISQGQAFREHALIFDQQIQAVCPTEEVEKFPVKEVIDARGLFVAPGLIDIHVHGCGGYDMMDASASSLEAMATCLAQHGVTAFLPTTMTVKWDKVGMALQVFREFARGNRSALWMGDTPLPVNKPNGSPCCRVAQELKCATAYVAKECPQQDSPTLLQRNEECRHAPPRWDEERLDRPGAQVLGVNLEGPFLSPEFKGAHALEHFALPDFDLIADYLDVIRIVTLAPELPGSAALLEKLAAYPQVVAAIGHSGASFEEARSAMTQGISHTTHLFNAMSSMHHRRPGVVGAVLTGGSSAELIADNLHVHPSLYSLLLKTLGSDRVILISDAMRAAALGDGTYEFGGQCVQVNKGAARLRDGTLAGSVLTLNRAVANFCRATGCEFAMAIGLASRNPARLLGLDQHIGDLKVGMRADIIIVDADCNVQQTFVAGRRVH